MCEYGYAFLAICSFSNPFPDKLLLHYCNKFIATMNANSVAYMALNATVAELTVEVMNFSDFADVFVVFKHLLTS